MGTLSLLMIAVGAVLTFAVTAVVDGLDVAAVGVILMIVGAVGLIFSLASGSFTSFGGWRTERHMSADGRHYVEETHGRAV